MPTVLKGALSLLGGLRLLLARAELRAVLWRMLGLLVLMLLLLMAGTFWLAVTLAEMFMPTGDAWYVDALAWLVWLFALILSLGAGIVGFVTLGSIAAAPWLDALCVRVERLAGKALNEPDQPWWKLVAASMWNAFIPLLNFLPWALLALLLLLVPVIGTVAAGVIWAYAGLRLLSFEFMDAPAARRDWQWKERKSELAQNKWFYLGFSGIASLLLVVPILNLFVLPAAVVGLAKRMLESRQESES